MTTTVKTSSISFDNLENLSDNDIDKLLDEIHTLKQNSSLLSLSDDNNISHIPKLSHQITFSRLKSSVFAELHDKDHVEQERITWFKLQQWIEFEWFDKLYQENTIKQHYLNDIRKAKTDYKSYTDKILIKYFNCPFKATKSNQFAEAFIVNKTSGDAFVDFNFPYFFAKGLNHYVLFSRYDIINKMGDKQMKRLISHYIEDKQYTDEILSENDKYEFVYYEERDKLSFLRSEQYEFENEYKVPLLSEIIDSNIIPNIIHVFINVTAVYRVTLGANNATWADQSFLWEEASMIIKNKDIEKFGREEKWIRKYIADRNKNRNKKNKNKNKNDDDEKKEKEKPKEIGFNSIRDKILIKEFKCKSEINSENNKLKAIVDDTTPRLLWTENLYPYFYEKGIQHNLVWYLDKTLDEKVLNEYIGKNIDENMEYIYWENPPHLKSIPDLNHYQVISVNMNEYMRNIKHLNYVTKAYEWNEFINNKNIIEKHKCDFDFGSNERVCRRYLQEIEETKMRFNSLIHSDLRRYFKCKVKTNEFGKLIIDEKDIKNYKYDHQKYVFVWDRYHFHLQNGLKQYLLIVWDDKKWDNKKIKQILKFELDVIDENNGNNFVFWEKIQKEVETVNLWYYHVIHNEKLNPLM